MQMTDRDRQTGERRAFSGQGAVGANRIEDGASATLDSTPPRRKREAGLSAAIRRRWGVGFLAFLLGGWPSFVYALPQGGQIVAGAGNIQQPSPASMAVNQSSDKMIVNWRSFGIGAPESVRFNQPNAGSIALNRVVGQDPSVIMGQLSANGRILLTNGSGIYFGPGSRVDVGGLLATTMNIANQDFLNGIYKFAHDPAKPLASVVNEGQINAAPGGFVGLLAPATVNRGTIVASLGSVALGSAMTATVDFSGDGLINFALTGETRGDVRDIKGNVLKDRVANLGAIHADGGQVTLSARDAGEIIRSVVNNSGIVEARTVVQREGRIFLDGGPKGVVSVSGALEASGKNAGERGGEVRVLGEKAGLFGGAKIDVSGDSGGGVALVGGDTLGQGPLPTAVAVFVDETASVNAEALGRGNGGKVVVFAEGVSRIYGNLGARGGAAGGDGGFVETSGKKYFEIAKIPDVTAPKGKGGLWLIDPNDIDIVAGSGNVNINAASPFATADDSAQLGVDLIVAALTGGASVTVTTGTAGTNAQTGNITLSADLDFNGTGTNALSFSAHNNININANILDSATGTSDTLNLALIADSDASGAGDLTVASGKSISTGNGSLSLIANDMTLTGSVNTGTGNASITTSDGASIGLGSAICGGTCGMTIGGSELQNIATGTLTVNMPSSAGIYADGISSANSANISTVVLGHAGAANVAGTVSLSGSGSTFKALAVNANNGITVNVNLTTSTGSLSLDGDANASANGTDNIAIADGVTIQSAEGLSLTAASSGISSAGTATLNAASGVAIASHFTASGGATTINADTDANGLGDFTISASKVLSTTGHNLSIKANDVHIGGFLTAATGNVTIGVSDGASIGLGAATCGGTCGMTIDGSEMETITANTLTVDMPSSAGIYVDGITATNSANINTVVLGHASGANTAGTATFSGSGSTFKALQVNAGGDIAVLADVTTNTGNFTAVADQDNNGAGSFTLASGKTVSSAGNISITARGIANNGTLSAAGTKTLTDTTPSTTTTTTTSSSTATDTTTASSSTGTTTTTESTTTTTVAITEAKQTSTETAQSSFVSLFIQNSQSSSSTSKPNC
ncbi:MAG: filamentous hemagglutinin N-terminal domain-containing protein [Nitrospinae bacterium]|nr:filamentous hemagglutinin N-terminal domain-containing protein [Nitrospinota bacterium]